MVRNYLAERRIQMKFDASNFGCLAFHSEATVEERMEEIVPSVVEEKMIP